MGRFTLTRVVSAALVLVVGLVTLFGLLVGDNLGLFSTIVTVLPIRALAQIFIRVAVLTIAFTILIGIFNLLFVHANRMRQGRTRLARLGGAVVIGSFVVGVLSVVMDRTQGTTMTGLLLENVQVAIEASLAGLVFFALVYGAIRILHNQVNPARVLFVLTILLVLVAAVNLPQLDVLVDVRDWLMRVPVSAGGRGILLGVALATVVTGVRVLFGQDRSYGE